MKEVIIVGAGLSGLTAAWFLHKEGIKPLVLEARDRWGGRILTVSAKGNATPVEMGATWFTDSHSNLIRLLKELSLSFYPQYQKGAGVFETNLAEAAQLFQIPPGGESSYRIAGGTARLTDALVDQSGREHLLLNTPVIKVADKEDHLEITGNGGELFTCNRLITTIPPSLMMAQKIAFTPPLPADLAHVMEHTHTWMGEAIKFAVEYKDPFWRKKGYAGLVFSNVGIAGEVHDHCSVEEGHYALKGFLSAEALLLSSKEREAEVIGQLGRLLGKEAANYLSYTEKLWQEDPFTFEPYKKALLPRQNNGHSIYSWPLMNGKLFLAGTETASRFGGYLEGAVYSGLATARAVLQKITPPA